LASKKQSVEIQKRPYGQKIETVEKTVTIPGVASPGWRWIRLPVAFNSKAH
jgi:hypothetical protein